ncbi:MAG: hypothetical protein HYX74_11295 [Acidobacteria bacterium]|nr:hypothetical protein [Acidobacteriota bacterium]
MKRQGIHSSALSVRRDIAEKYRPLFGEKRGRGGILNVEGLIVAWTEQFQAQFGQLLTARREFLHHVAANNARYGFLPPDQIVFDADGRHLTVAQIRQGMLDNFYQRKSPFQWRLNACVAAPEEVTRPGLQGTGPFDDLGMAISALNARTVSWMADWEDAGNDYQDKLYQAWKNLGELLAGEWEDRSYLHPTKKREYSIRVPRRLWPALFVRVPGLHLKNRQMTLDGEAVPAMIPALILHALNNYESQKGHHSGIYFYIPKIETPDEALLVAGLLKALEEALGLARGAIKIEMLNERGRYTASQEAIMWVLRDWLVGPNVGRWDYLNSRIEMGKDDPQWVFPDPHKVGMTDRTMTAYTRRNALLTLLVGGFPVGGMSAVMKNPRQSKEINDQAVRSIWFDKLRERLTGLFVVDGRPYDTYRQSWVATTEEEYVRAGEGPLQARFQWNDPSSELAELAGRTKGGERRLLEDLGVLRDGRISPRIVSREDLEPERLFSQEAWDELFDRPAGETTEEGLRYAIYMASEYMFQQLNGNNAAAIDDYLTGARLMNDFATYEIFWHWLWTVVHHRVGLTQDGKTTRQGEAITPAMVCRLLDERTKAVESYFAEQDRRGIASRFDRRKAPLVMELLRRQILHPQWITYGARVLLSLVESGPAEQDQILEAVFSPSAEAVAQKVQSGQLPSAALHCYKYVYDMGDSI